MFFLSAFDRPFDKTADGRDIPTHVTEEYLETGKVTYNEKGEAIPVQQPVSGQSVGAGSPVTGGQSVVVGQPIVFDGASVGSSDSSLNVESVGSPVSEQASVSENEENIPASSPVASTTVWVGSQQNVTPEMAEAQSNYVEELKKLVETLEKVNEQSTRLTRDSEEMENLNRTLTGISKFYEMQLKGASQQIGTIDQINEQSRKMAQQIEQLNKIYSRMIEAMTVNMRVAAPHVSEE